MVEELVFGEVWFVTKFSVIQVSVQPTVSCSMYRSSPVIS